MRTKLRLHPKYPRDLGASPGLTPFEHDTFQAEQVYLKGMNRDSTHPYLIAGWQGYDVPFRLQLTEAQARWLAFAILDDLTSGGTK